MNNLQYLEESKN